MSDRPYTVLSCGMSIDGYLGGPTEQRMLLSNEADFDRVDEVRASCDAILVGAITLQHDDPRLLVRAPDRVARRVARGQSPSPMKVTVTGGGRLDAHSRFFTLGAAEKIVYCASGSASEARHRVGRVATVLDGGEPVAMRTVSHDLHDRGVRRLLVEGGGIVHTQFLTEDLADELHLVVAPFFVGDARARRFVGEGRFPFNPDRRATLAQVRQIGDVVLLRYALSDRFEPG